MDFRLKIVNVFNLYLGTNNDVTRTFYASVPENAWFYASLLSFCRCVSTIYITSDISLLLLTTLPLFFRQIHIYKYLLRKIYKSQITKDILMVFLIYSWHFELDTHQNTCQNYYLKLMQTIKQGSKKNLGMVDADC